MPKEIILKEEYDKLLVKYQKLKKENERLTELLKLNKISFNNNSNERALKDENNTTSLICDNRISLSKITNKYSTQDEKISLFLSLFKGRKDVYALYFENKQKGIKGYSPVCKNKWLENVCMLPKKSCTICQNKAYSPYDIEAVRKHLSSSYDDIIGIYPLLKDDTCYFLAIDFDDKNFKDDVIAVKIICTDFNIPCSVEISKSGNGAHIWFFFNEKIMASMARKMGSLIITLSMKLNSKLSFSSYDRMFPNQDTLPKGGLGNLIALPLQPEAARLRKGSLFVDDDFKPYRDQFAYLSTIKKLNFNDVNNIISKFDEPVLGTLIKKDFDLDDKNYNPWEKMKDDEILKNDPTKKLSCVISDRIYIQTNEVSNKVQNILKRLAAFQNPEFYKREAMRMSVWNTPRIISIGEYKGNYLCLPRGLKDAVCNFAIRNNIEVDFEDKQSKGKKIDVSFKGTLYNEQEIALKNLMKLDKGILFAKTAFGKTVVAASLIAKKKVNTLILVNRVQLLNQWKERLTEFIDIKETLNFNDEIVNKHKKNSIKQEDSIIGTYGASKNTCHNIIDIAMIQSIKINDKTINFLNEYGMIIVDECHHMPAKSFESVFKNIKAKITYGLTATLKRKDGLHPIIPMYLGDVRYEAQAKSENEKKDFEYIMIPRFTGVVIASNAFTLENEESANLEKQKNFNISSYYNQIIEDDIRNHLIVDDVISCIKENRNLLIISERVSHITILAELIKKEYKDVIVLVGGKNNKKNCELLNLIHSTSKNKPLVILATGKYIGEGFDEARLDTLFLTMPISFEGILTQYTGRLQRQYEGKKEIRVYDYIDEGVQVFEKMYKKRLRAYASLGFKVCVEKSDTYINNDIIYDEETFIELFLKDIKNANKNIFIVSPFVKTRKVKWLIDEISKNSSNVSVTIITRPYDSFFGKTKDDVFNAILILRNNNIKVIFKELIHQKFTIIDEKIVWYGSINFLSFGTSKESIIRIITRNIALKLIKSVL